jgi:hypothetical protein
MYRDDEQAAAHHIERVEERVAQKEARVTPALLAELPAGLSTRLAEYRATVPSESSNCTARLAALERYEEVLSEAIALAPRLEEDLNTLPTRVEPSRAGPLRGLRVIDAEPSLWKRADVQLRSIVVDIDSNVAIDHPKHHVVDAVFGYQGHPMALRLQPTASGDSLPGEVELSIVTPVRRTMPSLDVRPLTYAHSLTKLLRIHRDIEIGDDEIDNRFLIQGDVDFIARAVSQAVRKDLLVIAKFDLPQLVVADSSTLDGVVRDARITWRWDATRPAFHAALRILAHLRSLNTTVRMLT